MHVADVRQLHGDDRYEMHEAGGGDRNDVRSTATTQRWRQHAAVDGDAMQPAVARRLRRHAVLMHYVLVVTSCLGTIYLIGSSIYFF